MAPIAEPIEPDSETKPRVLFFFLLVTFFG